MLGAAGFMQSPQPHATETKTLKDVMPHEFMSLSYEHERSRRHADIAVTREYYSHTRRWPGTHKNVHFWVELENGVAVGWNENPAIGWSFPMVRLRKSQ